MCTPIFEEQKTKPGERPRTGKRERTRFAKSVRKIMSESEEEVFYYPSDDESLEDSEAEPTEPQQETIKALIGQPKETPEESQPVSTFVFIVPTQATTDLGIEKLRPYASNLIIAHHNLNRGLDTEAFWEPGAAKDGAISVRDILSGAVKARNPDTQQYATKYAERLATLKGRGRIPMRSEGSKIEEMVASYKTAFPEAKFVEYGQNPYTECISVFGPEVATKSDKSVFVDRSTLDGPVLLGGDSLSVHVSARDLLNRGIDDISVLKDLLYHPRKFHGPPGIHVI
jgi:hypothetical protein